MIPYIAAAILLLVVVALGWGLLKKALAKATMLLLNGVAGLLILWFLNTYLCLGIPINIATVLVCGLFGIPGIGALVVLYFFGMI